MQAKIEQLRELGRRIDEWREAHDFSKNALCAKFGQLGSSKTFGRILDDQDDLTEGFDADKQLPNYQAAWELMQEYQEDPEENRIYGDFDFMRDGLSAVKEATNQTDNTRFVLVTAGSGGGKTAFRELLQADKHLGIVTTCVEATEAWRAKTTDFLGALLLELGNIDRRKDGERERKPQLPQSANDRLEKLVDRLDGKKHVLVIDEFHHVGPEGFNMVKTIINRTRSVVVGLAIPELIARIAKNSHAESKQLFFNRLYEHVRFGAPKAGDVLEFCKRRGLKFASHADANAICKSVGQDSYEMGLWKYVKRCAREAKRRNGTTGWTAEEFKPVIVKVKNSISLA